MLRQMDLALAQSNTLFVKMVNDTVALNQAILNFEPLELTSNLNLDSMFPTMKTSAQERETKRSEQVQSVSAIAQLPRPKMI